MTLYLVTWDLAGKLICPRMLSTSINPYMNQTGNLGPGILPAPPNPETWLFDSFEKAKEKAEQLCNVQGKIYSICSVEIMGSYKPVTAQWHDFE